MDTKRKGKVKLNHLAWPFSVIRGILQYKTRPFLSILLVLMLAGCGAVVGTTINTANKIEQSRDRGRLNDLVAAHLKWVKELQAKGDPMGDYLWAKANEDGMVDNPIKDPKIITQMYVDAAAKGSVDAQIRLGLKQFFAGSSTHRWDDGIVTKFNSRASIMQDGLKRIEQATQKQCWFYTPYIFPPQNKLCLTPAIAAIDPWAAFRDGYVYPKDDALRDYWKQKRDACESSPGYQEALRKCQPFGG